jgi:hypothetical protein
VWCRFVFLFLEDTSYSASSRSCVYPLYSASHSSVHPPSCTPTALHVACLPSFLAYTFATVKAAGHEALAYQPASSYTLFSAFLNNQELPK